MILLDSSSGFLNDKIDTSLDIIKEVVDNGGGNLSIKLSINPTSFLRRDASSSPTVDNSFSLGDSAHRFKNIYCDKLNGTATNSDLLDGHDSSETPAANKIPVAGSDGKLNLSWFNLPAKGMIYSASFDITASHLGSPVSYTFDFSNWYNDYITNVNSNLGPSAFLVIPITTFSIFRVGNPNPAVETGVPSMGDYFWVDYNASAPTYLDNTKYKFVMKLGATGTSSDGTSHSYSTKGYCGFRIYFLGGPEGVLFRTGLTFSQT